MAYQYIVGVGGVIACLLGLVFLYYNSFVRGFKKTRTASMEFPMENCVTKTENCEVAGSTESTDIIIVGAGVAGAALAYSLGKDGRRVSMIEKDLNPPNRIAGEGLLPGGYLKLIELGLEDKQENQTYIGTLFFLFLSFLFFILTMVSGTADCVDEIDAQRVLGYDLYKDGKNAKIPYPLEKFESHVAARTFHNGRFVQRLREKAASLHNVSLEQGTVTSMLEESGTIKGVHYRNKSGQELTAYAPLTIACDGGFSNLRRSLCNPKVDVPSYFVGLILKNCELPHANFLAQILADPSPILFYPISSTELRCLVDVPSQNLPSVSNGEMAHYLKTVVAPQVPPELYAPLISAIEEKNNIRTMQNRTMSASPNPTPGALLIGDAFNMRHPITGGGMTVALSDVVVLRDLLRPLHNLDDASAVCKYLESFYTLRKPMASTINTTANVLHKVFSAPSDPTMDEMKQACFGYLNLGGFFTNGLVALISGLDTHPLSLAFHFFAMSIYGVGRLLLPFPSPKRMWNAAKFIWVASIILCPLIKSEGIRQTFFPLTVPAYYNRAPPSKNKDT